MDFSRKVTQCLEVIKVEPLEEETRQQELCFDTLKKIHKEGNKSETALQLSCDDTFQERAIKAKSAPEVDVVIRQLSSNERARAYSKLNELVRAKKFIYRQPEAYLFDQSRDALADNSLQPGAHGAGAVSSQRNRKRRFEESEEELESAEAKRCAYECNTAKLLWGMCKLSPDVATIKRVRYTYFYDTVPNVTSQPDVIMQTNSSPLHSNAFFALSPLSSETHDAFEQVPTNVLDLNSNRARNVSLEVLCSDNDDDEHLLLSDGNSQSHPVLSVTQSMTALINHVRITQHACADVIRSRSEGGSILKNHSQMSV